MFNGVPHCVYHEALNAMFAPTRDQARTFLIDAWAKYRRGEALSGLEQTALE